MDRILDIDLDFFLNRVSDSREDEKRLNKKKYYPWEKRTLKSFLENRCCLRINNPILGRVIKQHHQAFYFWRQLILNKRISVPFELVHIDAHSDLGVGDWGWIHVTSELLHRPVKERMYPDESSLLGINEANYLAFAIACRWIKKLTFIIHPTWEDDLMEVYFKDFNLNSGYIQLKKFDKEELFEKGFDSEPSLPDLEPEIPVLFVPILEYRSKLPFTLLTLSHSKSYTPKASDKLIRVIKSYIKKV
ncbi:hypothetical protein LCGC14_0906340 [marine sediment metagenome]|uniref:Uncharacterized protein n=1 Tax=marine sediment metagenome TaxID=412755 RepID=A0A0F9S1X0_9ZZZZ|nr:MAG: hypothetical protein Lokiarch_12200 [Candidatus Lokiarchaeum sp. GC14_75]